MELIFTIFAVASALSMFLIPKAYKVGILLVSYMLFSMVKLPVLGIQIIPVIAFCLILSELQSIGKYLRALFKSKLSLVIGAAVLTGIISIITSEHLHDFPKLVAFVVDEWLLKAFAILYSFFLIRKSQDLSIVLKVSAYGTVIMTIFALVNYLLGYSPVCEALFEGSLDGLDFTRTARFRVQSTFINPFDYGFMCLVCFFFHVYGVLSSREILPQAVVCMVSCLFGIVACNCRTILFCFGTGILIYLCAMNKDRHMKLLYVSYFAGLAVLAFILLPSFQKLVLSMFTIFDSYSGVDGSSINARIKQLVSVVSHIDGNYLFGRGVGYFNLDVGWINGAENSQDHDLLGLEGIFLSLLLERGVVGCLIYIIEMTVLLRIIRLSRHISRGEYSFAITAFSVFIIFSIMTGELLSKPVSLLLVGCALGFHLKRKQVLSVALSIMDKSQDEQ